MRTVGVVRPGRYSGGVFCVQRCDECIEQLEEFLSCQASAPRVGHRQTAVAKIARLAGAKSQLERRFVHIGGKYASGE